jgi:hypothetical protein
MNENEFEHDGKKYRAIDADDGCCIAGETPCAFFVDGECLIPCEGKCRCLPSMRSDGKCKIFKEVTP